MHDNLQEVCEVLDLIKHDRSLCLLAEMGCAGMSFIFLLGTIYFAKLYKEESNG